VWCDTLAATDVQTHTCGARTCRSETSRIPLLLVIRLSAPPAATSNLNEELMLSVGPIVKEKINKLIRVFSSVRVLFNDASGSSGSVALMVGD